MKGRVRLVGLRGRRKKAVVVVDVVDVVVAERGGRRRRGWEEGARRDFWVLVLLGCDSSPGGSVVLGPLSRIVRQNARCG